MTTSAPLSAVIAGIERQLAELWTPRPGEAAKARACTMNLVVVGSSEITAKYVAVVDDVTSAIPARAIVVTLDPDAAASGLEGDVSAVCADEATCSERVRVVARGSAAIRAGSAVEALLVPEIPTSLVWLGRVHVDDPVFLAMAQNAQRVILDTEYTSLSSLLGLARWARAGHDRPSVADLAWTRLATWQEMCARFFDEPKLQPHVHRIRRLVVKQASEPGAKLGSEAALLVGWLATRLRWKLQRVGGSVRLVRPDGETVALSLKAAARPPRTAPAALVALTLEAEAAGLVAKCSLERDLSSENDGAEVLLWKLDVDVPTATEQRVRLGANREARLLERTLRRPAYDAALAEAAHFAEELHEEGLVCQ